MSQWLESLLDPDLASLTAGALYAAVWSLVFVESGVLVAFWLPGDTVLFTAGLLTARPGSGVSLPLLAAGTAAAAVVGNAVGYWTGRHLGRPWLERRSARVQHHLARAEAFYDRYGALALVCARFIPWARTFVPVLAGVSRMPYWRFTAANLLGAVVWGSGLIVLGYAAASVPWLRTAAYVVAGVAVASSVVVPVVARVRAARRPRAPEPAPQPEPER
ncbi:DedA family protein [Quadrisphaera sp. DSM 44207]|uniref:DedA family protein n=1 Tax=Quadrisphaera sp. DSM 44207 TaxID=1881057 RepID=UPI000882B202|nr:DedA family protein [Quadrisphaera sp. DSM 44207]SDQ87723.1 membrane-associated protein [Quadrisphaera sp. DSM 44207]